jgi:tRNA (guanine-N7-)-methyltransferase
MEICSGQGEWVCAQAKADPTARWVAVELRHDRVADAVARMHLARVPNLCLVGPSDARHVLRHRIAPGSLDCVFVNHPEPPERTSGGSADSDGQHLLDAPFLALLARALKPQGTLTLVTDSAPYVAAPLAKL